MQMFLIMLVLLLPRQLNPVITTSALILDNLTLDGLSSAPLGNFARSPPSNLRGGRNEERGGGFVGCGTGDR